MIELKPIPVSGLVSNKNKTISPNKHYAAYATNNGRVLNIINLKDKDHLSIAEKDFSYDFCSLFNNSIKLYQITFNNKSDKLYCLVQKSQDTKLYQFNLFHNSNKPISKHWCKDITTILPFDVKSFILNEEKQELNLVGFTKKQVTYKVLKLQTQELINKNVEPVYSNITKIKLDPNNMKLSTLSENKELNIFTETNNGLKVKKTVYDCNDIPVSSEDGNLLVDKKLNTLEIRSLLVPHHGKVVYRANCKFPIVDFSINLAGNKIKVFSQQYQNMNDNIHYSTFYTNGNPLLWNETDHETSLEMNLKKNYPTIYYTNKICSLFTDDNKLVILFNKFFAFPSDCNLRQAKNIEIITEQVRESRRQQYINRNYQNFRPATRSTNYSSNYSNNTSSLAFTSLIASTAVSSSSGYSSCSSYGGGCDSGGGGCE